MIIGHFLKNLIRQSRLSNYQFQSMNKQFAEYVIQNYDKPMGVTTYKSLSEMPEAMQKVLPDINDMEKFL